MGTSTSEGESQEQSRFKSPIQAELTLDKQNFPKCPGLTINDPYRTCPCCSQSISEVEAQSRWEWSAHITENLSLYTCIVEDCSEGDQLFSTRKSLWAHLEARHSKWECSFCDASLSDLPKLRLHLVDNHKSLLNETDYLSLEYQPACGPPLGLRSCPLCSSTAGEDSNELVNHVINHMFDFSLHFPPWIETYDEAGEAPEDSRMDSKAGH
uniref:C2H2-type domain-containing protein n=1 Tax=Bionectria ochroleuca TaxID=29856 RepID=A0A8H7NFX7_BIOOC